MGIISDTIREQRLELILILAGAFCLFASILSEELEAAIAIPIVICGVPIIIGAIKGVLFERDITADLLVSIAMVASIIIGEYHAAAEIAIIMQIGSFLEEATVNHANNCIRSLNGLRPSVARLMTDGEEKIVQTEELETGHIIRVLPGEVVPSDGIITAGYSSLDTSFLTGEPVPRDVTVGDAVSSGTINMYGAIDMEVRKNENGSAVDRMVKLIEEADAGRSKIVRTADRWAVCIVMIALVVSVITYIVTKDIHRTVTVLVVFCPCALILATPTAIMAAAANLSRHGILVKDGGALERLSKVDTVLIDKTGTLTEGRMECLSLVCMSDGMTASEMTRSVCSLENLSEHPIGKAIAAAAEEYAEIEGFEYVPGRGVSGRVEGRIFYAGNASFLETMCPDGFRDVHTTATELEEVGFSVVYIGCGGESIGYAVLSDRMREEVPYTIRHLRMLRLRSIMLTGDTKASAQRISSAAGVDDVVWECLPSDKLRIVANIDDEGNVCMVGDGVNDAPSLKRASVGISIYSPNNDIASESSDIVLMNDDLTRLPGLVSMSRRTMRTINLGIAFSLMLNTLAMALAVMGMLGPVEGAIVHNVGSVFVISMAAMLLRYDPWKPGRHRVRKKFGPVGIEGE